MSKPWYPLRYLELLLSLSLSFSLSLFSLSLSLSLSLTSLTCSSSWTSVVWNHSSSPCCSSSNTNSTCRSSAGLSVAVLRPTGSVSRFSSRTARAASRFDMPRTSICSTRSHDAGLRLRRRRPSPPPSLSYPYPYPYPSSPLPSPGLGSRSKRYTRYSDSASRASSAVSGRSLRMSEILTGVSGLAVYGAAYFCGCCCCCGCRGGDWSGS